MLGVAINFTDYDFRPPSVKLVNPFTQVPYKANELPTLLKRRVPAAIPPQLAGVPGIAAVSEQQLVQQYENEEPFICLPGIREYHDNPGHSGDDWLLHRGSSAGSLHFVLHQISRYGVEPLLHYTVGLQVTGFAQRDPPE